MFTYFGWGCAVAILIWRQQASERRLQRAALRAVERLGADVSGMDIRQYLDESGGRDGHPLDGVTIGRMYFYLNRHEEEGRLTSRKIAGGPERNFRPAVLFTITREGQNWLNRH